MRLLSSVASAAAAGGAASAAGGLLAEVDVIIDGGIDGLCVQGHSGPGEYLVLPGLDAECAAGGRSKQASCPDDGTNEAADMHGVTSGTQGAFSSERICCTRASRSAKRNPSWRD